MSKIIGNLRRTLWKTSALKQTILGYPEKEIQNAMPDKNEQVEKATKTSQEILVKEIPSSNSAKIKEHQAFFQREDGNMPTYLKAGMRDKHLFNVTLIVLGIGIAMSMETVLKLVVDDK